MITPDELDLQLRRPLAARAISLSLCHSGQPLPAWFACTGLNDLAPAGPAPETFLNDAELSRASVFKFEKPRQNFILGRLAAKAALGAFLNEPDWSRIGVANGALGQPLVQYPLNHAAEVSLSHVDGLTAAVAFPRTHPMGIDLELIDPDRVATVKSEVKLLPEEAQWLQSGLAPEPAALIMLWTIREALGKVLRCGIGCPLEQLGVNQISSPDTAGTFHGNYQSFPAYQCIAWVMANRVITIALPKSLIRPSKNLFLP